VLTQDAGLAARRAGHSKMSGMIDWNHSLADSQRTDLRMKTPGVEGIPGGSDPVLSARLSYAARPLSACAITRTLSFAASPADIFPTPGTEPVSIESGLRDLLSIWQ
jgi:hypothetical protein